MSVHVGSPCHPTLALSASTSVFCIHLQIISLDVLGNGPHASRDVAGDGSAQMPRAVIMIRKADARNTPDFTRQLWRAGYPQVERENHHPEVNRPAAPVPIFSSAGRT